MSLLIIPDRFEWNYFISVIYHRLYVTKHNQINIYYNIIKSYQPWIIR